MTVTRSLIRDLVHDQTRNLTNNWFEGGVAVATITLSATTIPENAAINDVIGVLSVINGSGTYTFTETADPDSKFNISGANLRVGAVLDFETDTTHPVTIEADNGVDPPISREFFIAVTDVAEDYEFDLANDSLVWVSDETVAIAVFSIEIPQDVPAGYKIYGEASLSSATNWDGSFVTPFDTESEAISLDDLGDLQIDSFAFDAFSNGDTVYVHVRIDDASNVQASNWSNVVSETMVLGGGFVPTFHIYGF